MQNGKFGSMFEKLKKEYQGKKVFLTGHTGFKGAWLLQTLSMLGAIVKGYALAPKTDEDLYSLINGDNLCNSVIADLRDVIRLKKEVEDFQPDFIFHLAAQPLVRLSYEIPSETFEVNAIGTAYLLDAIRVLEKKCTVVLITTDKVYHNYERDYPYQENDRLGGYDPYSSSKACAELVIDSYRNSFFNILNYQSHKKGVAVARAGNVIGGGDWSQDRLIPDILRALIRKEVVVIRNPEAVRPWQHVLEPVIGYLILGSKLCSEPLLYSEPYNFGPNTADTLPVLEMVKEAINAYGSGDFIIQSDPAQLHEAGLLKLDISKAVSSLGWMPKMNASQAVVKTVDWYKAFIDKKDMSLYTKEQIQLFLANFENH